MYLKNAHGKQLRYDEIYQLFGLNPKRHLPDAGCKPITIDNVTCWIEPKLSIPQDAARLRCYCPNCGRNLTTGKLQQHLKACVDYQMTIAICRFEKDGERKLLAVTDALPDAWNYSAVAYSIAYAEGRTPPRHPMPAIYNPMSQLEYEYRMLRDYHLSRV